MSGEVDKITGRVKEAVGVLTDDDKLRRDGKLDQTAGEVKDAAGKLVDEIKKKLDKPS